MQDAFADPTAVAAALDGAGYLPDDGLATAAFLAMRMGRPLFLEGDPGRRQDRAGPGAGDDHRRRACCGCSATRASTRARRSTTGTSRARSCTCARPATARTPPTLEASLYDRRFLVARPILQALERSPGGAAHRRDRPRRRRVRGVPARGAGRERGDDPRARHDHRGRAAARGDHVQPHPRGARRAQAALPVPLGGAPGLRNARSRSSGAGCRRSASSWPMTSRARSAGCARRGCSNRPGSPRRSTGPRRCTSSGARGSTRRPRRPTLGAVLKYHEDIARVQRELDALLGGLTADDRSRPTPDPVVAMTGFARALRADGRRGRHDPADRGARRARRTSTSWTPGRSTGPAG